MLTYFDILRLRIYPLVVSLLGFLFVGIALTFFKGYFQIPFYLFSLFSFSLAFRLNSAYKSKVRSIYLLVRRNKQSIHPQSFKEYMQAPCGRQVVKIALAKLGKRAYYKTLAEEFPLHFIGRQSAKTKILFYKDGKEEFTLYSR